MHAECVALALAPLCPAAMLVFVRQSAFGVVLTMRLRVQYEPATFKTHLDSRANSFTIGLSRADKYRKLEDLFERLIRLQVQRGRQRSG